MHRNNRVLSITNGCRYIDNLTFGQIMQIRDAPLHSGPGLMRSRVTRYSLYGVIIAACAVVIATLSTSFVLTGEVSLTGAIQAQKDNAALWILNSMPFVFALWGQHVGSVMAKDVGDLVTGQTQAWRQKTEALERKAVHDATHDPLTDLPNRVLLRDRLDQAMVAARRSKQSVALLLLDLNRFKDINDTLGHYSGDRLLQQVGVRLREVIRASDTLSRLGGDEFGILLPSVASESDVRRVVDEVQRVFETPFVIKNMTLEVQASIGVALAPMHGTDVDTLLQRGDVAMYAAKEENRSFHVYDPGMDKHSSKRLCLLAQLRQAITRNELVLHYQPKVIAGENRIVGVEALIRWQHKEFGMVPPNEFIHLAEHSGQIGELSKWVLRKALDQAVIWQQKGLQLGVAVNISPTTLLDPDFPDFLTGLLVSHTLPNSTLTLEITESSLVKDPDLALEILERLAAMGIAISIDDFGTGYSSLSYLSKMPASELKIDKAFVTDMLNDQSNAAIVRATIDLAHNLGMIVVAEGVECENTLASLVSLKCDMVQGYYFSGPLPIHEFTPWLESHNSAA